MPKAKTHRGAAKRFKPNKAETRLKHRRTNRNHILTKKAQGRKRHLRFAGTVRDCAMRAVSTLLGER